MDEYLEGLRTHHLEKTVAPLGDDMVFNSTARTLGKRQFLRFLRYLYTAFPDWHYKHDPPEWREEMIVFKWRQGGRRQGADHPGDAQYAAAGPRFTHPDSPRSAVLGFHLTGWYAYSTTCPAPRLSECLTAGTTTNPTNVSSLEHNRTQHPISIT